jgi:hypothetical protein
MKKSLVVLMLAAALAGGCASTAPTTGGGGTTVVTSTNASAQRAVFTAKSTYAGLLQAAVAYKELKPCGAGVSQPCSDAVIVAQIQKADNVAATALDAAEAAVRTPQVGATAQDRAIATANAALAALSALLTNLTTR